MYPRPHGFLIHGVGRPARGMHFNPVIENKQPHRTMDGVVPMGHRIDNRLAQSLFRKLWSRFRLEPMDDVGHPEMQVQESRGLINHIEETPGKVLSIRRFHRTFDAGEASRIDLGKGEVVLQISTDEDHASNRGMSA
jgi:hypothetical protein